MDTQRSNLPVDWDELKWIFSQTFRSNPRYWQNYRTQRIGDGFEPSPIEDAAGSSPLIDYVRQHLPHTVADSWLGERLPYDAPEWLRNVRLGGYSPQLQADFMAARREHPGLRSNTVHKDYTPEFENPQLQNPIGDSGRRKAAQAAGVVASDLVGVQGLQNLYWLFNAAEAVTSIATLQAIHNAQRGISEVPTPLLKTRPMRWAAAAPAWIGMKFATGQFGRPAGYSVGVPSEADPTQTASPLLEFASDIFMGRAGELLPWDQFKQERPDVSKGEYEAYKAYLHGNKSPIKATLDGINGPEVNVLGKSIPVLTGVLPAVAMAAGARFGARRAARRLTENGTDPITGEIGVDLLRARKEAFERYNTLDGNSLMERHAADADSRADNREVLGKMLAKEKANREHVYNALNRAVENETLKNVILYGGGAMAGTALAGATLEQLRRLLKGPAPVTSEEAPTA